MRKKLQKILWGDDKNKVTRQVSKHDKRAAKEAIKNRNKQKKLLEKGEFGKNGQGRYAIKEMTKTAIQNREAQLIATCKLLLRLKGEEVSTKNASALANEVYQEYYKETQSSPTFDVLLEHINNLCQRYEGYEPVAQIQDGPEAIEQRLERMNHHDDGEIYADISEYDEISKFGQSEAEAEKSPQQEAQQLPRVSSSRVTLFQQERSSPIASSQNLGKDDTPSAGKIKTSRV